VTLHASRVYREKVRRIVVGCGCELCSRVSRRYLQTKDENIKTAWRLACRRAGIEALHFHDLRREAGSPWLEGGVPLHTVRAWLGHANISQTSTYLANTVQTQHDAMAAFERRIGALPLMQRMASRGGTGRNHPASRAKHTSVDTRKSTN
jgi:integrase